jgi:hypothetical protein
VRYGAKIAIARRESAERLSNDLSRHDANTASTLVDCADHAC